MVLHTADCFRELSYLRAELFWGKTLGKTFNIIVLSQVVIPSNKPSRSQALALSFLE